MIYVICIVMKHTLVISEIKVLSLGMRNISSYVMCTDLDFLEQQGKVIWLCLMKQDRLLEN